MVERSYTLREIDFIRNRISSKLLMKIRTPFYQVDLDKMVEEQTRTALLAGVDPYEEDDDGTIQDHATK